MRSLKFANIFHKLPKKYLAEMTDEQFFMAINYNIWPDFSIEQQSVIFDINVYLPIIKEEE